MRCVTTSLVALFAFSLMNLTSCGQDFMASDASNRVLIPLALIEGDDGLVSATLSAGADGVQTLQSNAASAIQGSAITIPSGSLALDLDLTIQEGSSIIDGSTNTYLGLQSSLQSAGPAVVFKPSQYVQSSSPFSISIPLSGALSLLETANYSVIYKKYIPEENNGVSYLMGVIPSHEILVIGNIVTFKTSHFGVFQIATSTEAITQAVSVPTYEPIVVKKSSTNKYVGIWLSACKDDVQEDGTTESRHNQLQIGESTFTFTEQQYNEGGCNTSTPHLKMIFSGSYALKGSSADITGADKVDIEMKKIAAIPLSSEVAESFNADQVCGLSNWAKGIPQSISDSECVDTYGETQDANVVPVTGMPSPSPDPGDCGGGPPAVGDILKMAFYVSSNILKMGDDCETAPKDANGYPTTLQSAEDNMTKQE